MWYQPLNGNAWFGHAAVLCQRGASVWLHSKGDIKKVAACRVKPYELVDRESNSGEGSSLPEDSPSGQDHVMLEDGLAEVEKDIVSAKYMKLKNSVCFSDSCIFVVELPVSEHGRLEVVEAKFKEVQNLEDYQTLASLAQN